MTLLYNVRDWLSEALYNLSEWINPAPEQPEPVAPPQPPTLYDVALGMKGDNGEYVQSISWRMRDQEFYDLCVSWSNAVRDARPRAGTYRIIRDGLIVYAGIMVSHIVAITAVPVIEKAQGEA